jgi:hypothetical protein
VGGAARSRTDFWTPRLLASSSPRVTLCAREVAYGVRLNLEI